MFKVNRIEKKIPKGVKHLRQDRTKIFLKSHLTNKSVAGYTISYPKSDIFMILHI